MEQCNHIPTHLTFPRLNARNSRHTPRNPPNHSGNVPRHRQHRRSNPAANASKDFHWFHLSIPRAFELRREKNRNPNANPIANATTRHAISESGGWEVLMKNPVPEFSRTSRGSLSILPAIHNTPPTRYASTDRTAAATPQQKLRSTVVLKKILPAPIYGEALAPSRRYRVLVDTAEIGRQSSYCSHLVLLY